MRCVLRSRVDNKAAGWTTLECIAQQRIHDRLQMGRECYRAVGRVVGSRRLVPACHAQPARARADRRHGGRNQGQRKKSDTTRSTASSGSPREHSAAAHGPTPPSNTFQATGSWAGKLHGLVCSSVSGHAPSGGTGSPNPVHSFLSTAALLASGIDVIYVPMNWQETASVARVESACNNVTVAKEPDVTGKKHLHNAPTAHTCRS